MVLRRIQDHRLKRRNLDVHACLELAPVVEIALDYRSGGNGGRYCCGLLDTHRVRILAMDFENVGQSDWRLESMSMMVTAPSYYGGDGHLRRGTSLLTHDGEPGGRIYWSETSGG